jgi:hypothetical protein
MCPWPNAIDPLAIKLRVDGPDFWEAKGDRIAPEKKTGN